ncbi:MAG: hypothetical protein AB1Z98_26395 [Nannocystaceae bacterium]
MKARLRRPAVLVFGEDDNDRRVIKHLVEALRPDAPRLELRRAPLVLVKDRKAALQRKNAQDIAKQVSRDQRRFDVRGVIAHQDCDALEPAHERLSAEIEQRLDHEGLNALAATPAWEMESWLFLWPDAAPELVRSWSRPARTGRRVGLIRDAKEAYRQALRPKTQRVYEESDSPKIVAKAIELGLVDAPPDARSDSFERFRERLRAMRL